jgi:hydroxypyruvate isomerase
VDSPTTPTCPCSSPSSRCSAADAVVLIEPVSGAPRYPLLTAGDAIGVIDRVHRDTGASNLRLLMDLYHLAVNGDDLDAAIRKHTARTGHVQIADVPGRHEPGTGRLDLAGYLAKLASAGYRGYGVLEYKPSGTTLDSLGWLAPDRRIHTTSPEGPA